jgi:glyoxylase-like metal-dependent hydrolase (beta-lactamase superfamily II)
MKIARDIFLVGSGQIGMSNQMDCHVYLIDCGEGELALVDAGVGIDTELLFNNVREEGYEERNIRYLFLTHAHADHGGGCKKIKRHTGCEIIATKVESELLASGSEEKLGLKVAKRSGIYPKDYKYPHCEVDYIVRDGEKISIGKYEVKVIEVSGHSKGTMCLLLNQGGYRILFSSDVVFYNGTIGLGNWPGSSLDDYRRDISKLGNLSVDALLPGHYIWTLRDGQRHLNKAVENLKYAWVPPAWQHQHAHF